MRCFTAIVLPEATRRMLARLGGASLRQSKAVRWNTQDQLHITLKFLGQVADEQLPAVCDAVRDASSQIAPFPVRCAGLGCFPAPRNPRVLWCGIEDPAEGCARWVAAAEPLLADLGFKPEARAYTPHVTLARSKSGEGNSILRRVLQDTAASQTEELMVRQVVLFESRLDSSGACYVPMATTRLGGT